MDEYTEDAEEWCDDEEVSYETQNKVFLMLGPMCTYVPVVTETVVLSLKLVNPHYHANCGRGERCGLNFSRTLHAILTTTPLEQQH